MMCKNVVFLAPENGKEYKILSIDKFDILSDDSIYFTYLESGSPMIRIAALLEFTESAYHPQSFVKFLCKMVKYHYLM